MTLSELLYFIRSLFIQLVRKVLGDLDELTEPGTSTCIIIFDITRTKNWKLFADICQITKSHFAVSQDPAGRWKVDCLVKKLMQSEFWHWHVREVGRVPSRLNPMSLLYTHTFKTLSRHCCMAVCPKLGDQLIKHGIELYNYSIGKNAFHTYPVVHKEVKSNASASAPINVNDKNILNLWNCVKLWYTLDS